MTMNNDTTTAKFPPIVWNDKTIPEARVRDKYQQNKNFLTMKSRFDIPNKRLEITNYIPGGCDPDYETIYISFDELCKEFGWKSFEFINNNETIKPKW